MWLNIILEDTTFVLILQQLCIKKGDFSISSVCGVLMPLSYVRFDPTLAFLASTNFSLCMHSWSFLSWFGDPHLCCLRFCFCHVTMLPCTIKQFPHNPVTAYSYK